MTQPEPHSSDSQSLLSHFSFFQQIFNRAARSVRPVDRFYKIGTEVVQLSFAGSALVPVLTDSLVHLRTDPVSHPSLRVCLWESLTTGVPMPPPPWAERDYLSRGLIDGFNDERILTVFQRGTDALQMFDRETKTGLYWVRSLQEVPISDSAYPLRLFLHEFARQRGCLVVHAGAVGTRSAGVLIAGKSGSGKSTTVLSCVDSDLLIAGDDTILLSCKPEPVGYSLYSIVKLTRSSLDLLPHFKPWVKNPDRIDLEKGYVCLHEERPDCFAPSLPLKAVLLPDISGRREEGFEQVSAAESLKALAPSSIFHVQSAGGYEFFEMSRLVKKLPAFRFHVGKDPRRIPARIERFLKEWER